MGLKTLKIKETTHYKLSMYKVKNKLKSLGGAINKLLREIVKENDKEKR